MNTRQLEIFIRVAELCSFSKAADVLQVSQSQLSRQVRALEQEIGKHLLYRNGRGVTLTEAGGLFLAQGRGIMRQFEAAKLAVSDVQGPLVGKVVVGMPSRVAASVAVPLVVRFRATSPHASLSIAEGPTASIHEWLITGRVDIGLLNNPPLSPQLHYEHVMSSPVVLLGPPDRPKPLPATLRLKELGAFPLILPCRPHAIRNLVDEVCGKRSVTLRVAHEIDLLPAIIELVERGFGYALVPLNTIPEFFKTGAIPMARIVAPTIESHLYVATPTHRMASPLARHTIDLLKERYAGSLTNRGPR
jgi:LysR family nitrogen assimilation transcriptional regulator